MWRCKCRDIAKSPTRDIEFPGGHRSRVTPVPIPNTEVKPATADGTARVGAWESRSLPGVIDRSPLVHANQRAFLRTFALDGPTVLATNACNRIAIRSPHLASTFPRAATIRVRLRRTAR